MGALATIERATEAVRKVTTLAPPDQVSGTDAKAMVEALARLEKAAGGARALYAATVAATGAYEEQGDANPARWLAKVTGEPVGRARGTLEAAQTLAGTPLLKDALLAGEVSLEQAKVAAAVASGDPALEASLVETAKGASFAELVGAAQRAARAKSSEEDARTREERLRARRYCRTYSPPEGGLRLEALLPADDGARVLAVLDRLTKEVFAEARRGGEPEPTARYRADALVRAVTGGGGKVRTEAVLRADVAALRRGEVAEGEVCELAGVGAVSVSLARELLGDAVFYALLHDGTDVRAVSGAGRGRRVAQEIALKERDPVCVVPGCPVASPLEVDHWRTDFARGGRTELDNLCRLCVEHHAMKTHRGWRLTGGPGAWGWVGPGQPVGEDKRPPDPPPGRPPEADSGGAGP
ncbi:MAG: HNH endonuclease signature motif containing protein, partial [Acidimicrobiales bacterium]